MGQTAFPAESILDSTSEGRDLLTSPSLADPNADRILIWDDSATGFRYATPGSGLTITGTSLDLDSDLAGIAGLADPNADRILFWDDSAGVYQHLSIGSGLSITGTTLDNTLDLSGYLPLAGGTMTGPITGTSNIVEFRNGTSAQTVRVSNTWTSDIIKEGIQLKCVASANSELATFVGSSGGTLRGITIGGYAAGASTITPWLSFTNAGVATFSSSEIKLTTTNHTLRIFELDSTHIRISGDKNVQFYANGASFSIKFTNNNDATRVAISSDSIIQGLAGFSLSGTNKALFVDGTAYKVQSYSLPLYLNALGNNTILNPTSGDVGIGIASPTSKLHVVQSVSTSGSPTALTLTGAAHTTLTASTEATDVNFNLARTVQFATGALTTQRAMRIQAPTYGFVGASTIATASTLSISGAPIAGTNATITNAYALNVENGAVRFANNSGYAIYQSGASALNSFAGSTTFTNTISGIQATFVTTNTAVIPLVVSGAVAHANYLQAWDLTGSGTQAAITSSGGFIGSTGVFTGAVDVQNSFQCNSLRIDQTPTLEAIVPTHSLTVNLNGTNYKIPVQAA